MNTDGIEKIIVRYTPLVETVVSGVLGRSKKQDIEELVSDVFVAYWKAEKYDCSDSGVKNLLITIARRQAINRMIKLNRHVYDELDDEISDGGLIDDEVISNIESSIIRKVINNLTPPDNEIFTRRYYYCQSVREIAHEMKLKVKYVENRLYLAKKTIREQLVSNGVNGEGR